MSSIGSWIYRYLDVTDDLPIDIYSVPCKHTIFPQKMPKIITISGNGKVGKKHPLSKKGIKNAFRMDSSALAAGFLTPHFQNNHLPGKFTNAKYQQTARLKKPSWFKGNLLRQEPIN